MLNSDHCNLAYITIPHNDFILDTYPNPFNFTVTKKLRYSGNTYVNLDIIDINGRIIGNIYSGYLNYDSAHAFNWSGGYINSGIYFVRLTNKHNVIIQKKCST